MLQFCGLAVIAGNSLADARTGKNGSHRLVGLLRQSVFGRPAGSEDVNDAERVRNDPAIRLDRGRQGVGQLRIVAEPSRPLRDAVGRGGHRTSKHLPIFHDNGLTGFIHKYIASARRLRARHEFERQSDSRRTREQHLR